MPGGRPPKPGTAEEKALARRERVRQHVQAHRQRKRLRHDSALAEHGRQSAQRPGSPSYITDVAYLSQKASIDLSFGLLPAIVHDFDTATGTRFPWMYTVQQLQPNDRIVDLAVLAAGARTLARIRSDGAMAEFSRLAYHQALQCLRPRLEAPDPEFALLLTTVPLALMSFESSDGSPRVIGSPWTAHASGCASLMRSAGPEAYQSKLGMIFFRGQRWIPHSLGLMNRKRCFLEDDDWQSVPFKFTPKNIEDLLWDCMVKTPGLLELADNLDIELRESLDTYYSTATTLQVGISKLQDSLKSWMRRLEMSSPDEPVYQEEPVAHWFRRGLPDVFTTSLQFRRFFEADWTMMHWSSLLGIQMLAHTTGKKLSDAGHIQLADSFDNVAGPRAARERIAFNICQSIEYCIGPDPNVIMGTATACHRPLQRAMMYFMSDPTRYAEEIKWCSGVEDLVASRGPHVKGYLKDAIR